MKACDVSGDSLLTYSDSEGKLETETVKDMKVESNLYTNNEKPIVVESDNILILSNIHSENDKIRKSPSNI